MHVLSFGSQKYFMFYFRKCSVNRPQAGREAEGDK